MMEPILTPLRLWAEIHLAFAWGTLMVERLLPTATFVAVMSATCWYLKRTRRLKEIKRDRVASSDINMNES